MNESEEKMTLAKIAQELGVSKSALYKRICKEPLQSELTSHIETINNTVYYSKEGIELIKNSPEIARMKENSMQRQGSAAPETVSGNDDESLMTAFKAAVELLQKQLKVKDEQLAEKDRFINDQLNKKNDQLEAKDAQIASLTEALRESQSIQRETMIALQAAEALHNSTMKQIPQKSETRWWQFRKRRKAKQSEPTEQ